mmetsp:Transcript_84280/g.243605  ORF Transcript_84280/g.243605 Transcript_84280/m.243605 type:complete len:235 (-) Transcript_84280:931-1635(-)
MFAARGVAGSPSRLPWAAKCCDHAAYSAVIFPSMICDSRRLNLFAHARWFKPPARDGSSLAVSTRRPSANAKADQSSSTCHRRNVRRASRGWTTASIWRCCLGCEGASRPTSPADACNAKPGGGRATRAAGNSGSLPARASSSRLHARPSSELPSSWSVSRMGGNGCRAGRRRRVGVLTAARAPDVYASFVVEAATAAATAAAEKAFAGNASTERCCWPGNCADRCCAPYFAAA